MLAYDPDPGSARADLCRFVSACYYEPAPEFAEERLFESMHTAAARVDAGLAECAHRLGQAFAGQDLQTLLVDYTRLFDGPLQPLARPYGSSWLARDATQMQDTAQAVLELYGQGGFQIDDGFRDLPDHVAVELEFLYLLAFTQHQARKSGDGDAAASAQRLQQRLLDEHLGAWIGPFASALRAGAQTEFYRELAPLTERLVQLMSRPSSEAGRSPRGA